MNAFEILSDDDKNNRTFGYAVLQSVRSALDDVENFRTAWAMWAALIQDDNLNTERIYLDAQQQGKSASTSFHYPSEVESSSVSASENASDEHNKGRVKSEISHMGTECPDGTSNGAPRETSPINVSGDKNNACESNKTPSPSQDDVDDTASVTSELCPLKSGYFYARWESCRYCGEALMLINELMRFCLDCPWRVCFEEECFEAFKA